VSKGTLSASVKATSAAARAVGLFHKGSDSRVPAETLRSEAAYRNDQKATMIQITEANKAIEPDRRTLRRDRETRRTECFRP
jgi:hypothetical protein